MSITTKAMLEREKCVLCRKILQQTELLLPDFPVYMGTTTGEQNEDLSADQSWSICSTCGIIQLRYLAPLDVLYAVNHSTEAVGDIWKNHHLAFADLVKRHIKKERCSILEIGAAHGTLARKILEDSNGDYTIIEPDATFYDPKIKFIKGFFEEHLNKLGDFDIIIHSHVLEHLYQPFDSLDKMIDNMKSGAKMISSFPNIESLISKAGANSLNFEHTYYLHPVHFEQFVISRGMVILEKKEYLDHSFFYVLERSLERKTQVKNVAIESIEWESREFISMWNKLKAIASLFEDKLGSLQSRDKFIFGAHVFTQALLYSGLGSHHFSGVLDNSKAKQGNRLYGTRLQVFNPEILHDLESPVVVVLTTHYQKEIEDQLLRINRNVTLLTI